MVGRDILCVPPLEGDVLVVDAHVQKNEGRKKTAVDLLRDFAIKSSINAMAMADLEGKLTYVNDSFLRMWGYEDEKEVLGKEVIQFWRQEGEAQEVVEALRTSGGWVGELAAQRKDGTSFDAQLSANMVLDESGESICMLASFVDVSERNRAVQMLGEREHMLNTLLDVLPIGVCLTDEEGRYTLVNDAYCKIYDYEREEIIGQHFAAIMPPDQLATAQAHYARLLQGDMGIPVERKRQRKDGSIVYIEAANALLVQEDGDRYVITTVRDVTGRKQMEEALRESDERFSLFMDRLPAGVFMKDIRGKVLYASKYLKDMFGAEEWIGKTTRELFPEEIAQAMIADDEKALSEGYHKLIEAIPDKEGIEHIYQTHKFAIERAGKSPILGGIGMDITEQVRAQEALQASEERFRRAVLEAPFPIMIHADDGEIVAISKAWTELSGYTQEDIPTISEWARKAYGERQEIIRADIDRLYDLDGRAAEGEYEIITSSGEVRTWDFSSAALGRGADGSRLVISMAMDVSQRKQAEEAVKESERRYRRLFELSNDAIFIYTAEGKIRDVNGRASDLLGYSRDKFLRMTIQSLHPQDKVELSYDAIRTVLAMGEARFESRMQRADGETIFVDISASLIDQEEELIQGIVRDISERVRLEKHLHEIATHDYLTGIPNRRLFQDRLKIALAQARRRHRLVAILYFDLDGFKIVNDTLGHEGGDEMLVLLARKMTEIIREGDTLARLGGDEFAVLIQDAYQVQDVVQIAERIMECFAAPIPLRGHEFNITASIGASIYPQDAEDGQTLLRYADDAMYVAKGRGRNQYCVYGEIQ